MKKILTNKNGSGYILTCVMVIISVVILLVLLQYMSVYHTAKVTVQHELLESPVTVYNFEVEGFHTYFVGSTSVLVHNRCGDEWSTI